MKSPIAIAPLFKGDAPNPSGPTEQQDRLRHEIVMTGKDPVTGVQVEPEAYVRAVEDTQRSNRQLAENAARIAAGVMHAVDVTMQGEREERFYVEGCAWNWGTQERKGAHTAADIDAALVSYTEFPVSIPQVRFQSNRTRREFEAVLGVVPDKEDSKIHAITHKYHQQRSANILRAVAHDMQFTGEQKVFTPEEIRKQNVRRIHRDSRLLFLEDVIKAGEPSAAVRLKEGIMENAILKPLNTVSRALERASRLVGVRFDLEGFIAQRKAGRGISA